MFYGTLCGQELQENSSCPTRRRYKIGTKNNKFMENKIQQRLQKLRKLMKKNNLSAFIFPSTDPHQGEYIPDHWKGREWISGFDGSAGTAVVTLKSAALWTDSRYFIAAEEQLKGTDYVLMKERVEGTPRFRSGLRASLKAAKTFM